MRIFFLFIFIFLQKVNSIYLIIKLKYESNTFLDFINDDSIKNKEKENNIDNKEKTNNIDNNEKRNNINNNENINNIDIKEKINNIDNNEEIKNIDNKDKTNIIDNKNNKDNLLLLKEIEDYKIKINKLKKIIKNLEIKLIEKDKLLNEEKTKNCNLNKKIKEIGIEIISDNKAKANKIIELENEIKLFRTYYKFSSNEKLISINFISVNQEIDLTVISKNTDDFSKIEKILYEKYPHYKDTENYFLVNGSKINRNRTLEENKIRNNDKLTLEIYNFE